MTLKDALLLGRVSNLPTVWTNALTGLFLAGFDFSANSGGILKLAFVILAMSLFYVGGMYLNDAFDAGFDAKARAERPIPSGAVDRRTVFIAGYALLGGGLLATLLAALSIPAVDFIGAGMSGVALVAAIIFYDWRHKSNPLSPFIMAVCRALVYVTAGLCVTLALPPSVLLAASIVFCYLIGLSTAAKQETLGRLGTLWPLLPLAAPVAFGSFYAVGQPWVILFTVLLSVWVAFCVWLIMRGGSLIPLAVANLIAGIALCDAVLLAVAGAAELSFLAVGGFVLTLGLQRVVPGT